MSGPVIAILVAMILLVAAIVASYELARLLRPYPDGFKPSHEVRAQQPAPVHHENPSIGLDTLERVRAGLLALPLLPDDPPPADTAEFPAVVNDMGLPSDNEEYIDALFAKAEAEFGVLPDFRVAEKMAAAIMPGGLIL